MHTVEVDLGVRSYPIHIGPNLLSQVDILFPYIKSQVMVVSNTTVAPLYMETVVAQLSVSFRVDTIELPDGESYKHLDTINKIFDALLTKKHNRSSTIVALGGGVVGDMAGFAAAAYQRGINFIQIPTTLLSQVDSSVGGKTGVNHPLGKNMIGAFHQPQAVLIDTLVLSTLSDKELRAGFAEVIKYGLIIDYPFFEWLEDNMDKVLARDPDALAYCIKQSCISKADVVSQDEKESGIRAILNLGHTFGHAIEAHQGYGNWLHGEAVAAGMVMASDLSLRMGWITSDFHERVIAIIKRSGLPVNPPENMTENDFLHYMSVDKKVLDGNLRLVLLKEPGKAVVCDNIDAKLLSQTFNHKI